jgi:hypothetical protein
MSRDDAIKFLEDVNADLSYLRHQYKLSLSQDEEKVSSESAPPTVPTDATMINGNEDPNNNGFIQKKASFDGNRPAEATTQPPSIST